MNRGILLMCHTSHFYGKWAFNIAHSIKYYNPEIKIHLACDISSISGIDLTIFDSISHHEFSNDYGFEKLNLFDKSPFEETIYLDVDGIVLKDLNPLFDTLKGSDIWAMPMGLGQKNDDITYTWANNELVWKRFGLKEDSWFNTTQTSIIYFTKESKGFFSQLKENYKNRLDISEYKEKWGRSNQHPDELYYSITLAQQGKILQELEPIFFPEKLKEISDIIEEHYILSMWGAGNAKPYARDLYDRIMNKILRSKGMNHSYKVYNLYKNKFIT